MRLYNLYSKLETAIEDPCVSDFVASTPLASALQNLSAQRERSFQFLRGIHVSSCLKDQGVWSRSVFRPKARICKSFEQDGHIWKLKHWQPPSNKC